MPKRTLLIHVSDGRPVKIGDVVTSFRGAERVVSGWRPPHKQGSTGKIIVKGREFDQDYYPSVFACKFVKPPKEV